MKRLVLVLLLLGVAFMGCATKKTTPPPATSPPPTTQVTPTTVSTETTPIPPSNETVIEDLINLTKQIESIDFNI